MGYPQTGKNRRASTFRMPERTPFFILLAHQRPLNGLFHLAPAWPHSRRPWEEVTLALTHANPSASPTGSTSPTIRGRVDY